MRNSMRAALLAAVGLTGGAAMAQFHDLAAEQDLNQVSDFTLDFQFIPATPSVISFTQFDVAIDETAGTASFTDYYQEVAPLFLPAPDGSGFLSTGDLVIEIVPGSSFGTFDAVAGTFTTTDLYAIHFTGDLSAFGFTSPVILPGDSLGQLLNTDGVLSAGDISLDWDGEGFLPNPNDPGNPINFTYTCRTRTNFENGGRCGGATCPGDVTADCGVDLDDVTAILANFGEAQFFTTPRRGDLDGNQSVDLDDLLVALANFNSVCGE